MPARDTFMSFMEAFNPDTATRKVVLSRSLSKGDPNNKIVRQSLGFRELKDGPGIPKFASRAVTSLHTALDTLVLTLPYHDVNELRSEWKKGQLLQGDLEQLLNEYGPRIWGIPVIERDSAEQHDTPLLRAGDNKFYTKDLMWGIGSHKRYIKLQLEHLVYIKANRYRVNHGAPSNPRPTPVAEVRAQEINTEVEYDTQARTNMSATMDEHAASMPGGKHHVDDDEEWTPYTNFRKRKSVMHEEEDASERRPARSSKFTRSYTTMYPEQMVSPADPPDDGGQDCQDENEVVRSTVESNDVQNAQAAINLAEGNTGEVLRQSHLTAERLQSNDDGSSLTEVPENLSDCAPDLEQDLQPNLLSLNIQQVADPSRGQDVALEENQGMQESSEATDNSTTGNSEHFRDLKYDEQGALPKESVNSQEKETAIMSRIELRELLRRDLGGTIPRSPNSTEEGIFEMWDNTENLNGALESMWKAEQDSLKHKMGPQLYECRDFVIGMWISWRQHAREIGIVINCHPARNKMPEYSYEVWVEKLGGDLAVENMEEQLYRCWKCLQQFKRKTDEKEARDKVAEHLSAALSELTKQPAGRWISLVKRFNDKLFAWGPDLEYI